MARLAKLLAGALAGLVAGYFAGVYAGCAVYPDSNLCGIWGVFVTAPIGALLGAAIGWRLARPMRAA